VTYRLPLRAVQVLLVGFLRPEVKFENVEALVARIKADIAIAKTQLDVPALSQLAQELED
jgi:riboflavin kinase